MLTCVSCDRPRADGAPVPLCAGHLALAHDWLEAEVGDPDVLPSPCVICGSQLGVRLASSWVCGVCEWRHGEVPDAELPPPRIDVVYYIQFDDRIKIGTSTNPRQRLARLWHQELLAFERGGRSLEHQRHEQFAADRWPGTEWFHRTDELVAHVAVLAAGIDDPWHLHARWTAEAYAARG
jgi:hypothetical protein